MGTGIIGTGSTRATTHVIGTGTGTTTAEIGRPPRTGSEAQNNIVNHTHGKFYEGTLTEVNIVGGKDKNTDRTVQRKNKPGISKFDMNTCFIFIFRLKTSSITFWQKTFQTEKH